MKIYFALALSLMCLVLSEDDCGSCTETQTCIDVYGVYKRCYENCIESPARITEACACGGDTSEACWGGGVCNEGRCLQGPEYCFGSFGYNDSCHVKKTEAACGSPCWWYSSCQQCVVPRCGMYSTKETCTVSSGKDCVWKEGRLCGNSIVGCCQEAHCSDRGTEETCTGTVNDETCVWNPSNSSCAAAGCYDYYHSTEETCLGTVNGETCVWLVPASCHQASCYSYSTADTCKGNVNGETCVWIPDFYGAYCDRFGCNAYLTTDTCKGTIGNDSCVWNPNFNNSGIPRCVRYSCNSYEHDSPTTCVGVVGGYTCVWDSIRGFCTNGKSDSEKDNSEICHGADGDEESCKGKSTEYGCIWSDGKCNGNSSEICHGADGDEESCKGKSKEYGCVWSNGKCNGENSFALSIASPTLLIVFLLALIF